MSEEKQDQTTASETTDAAATATDRIEDLEPSEDETDGVTGGSTPPGPGWNRVKNPQY